MMLNVFYSLFKDGTFIFMKPQQYLFAQFTCIMLVIYDNGLSIVHSLYEAYIIYTQMGDLVSDCGSRVGGPLAAQRVFLMGIRPKYDNITMIRY